MRLSQDVERLLGELGLSANEVRVYLLLAKSGPLRAMEISKNLKIHKVEVYRFLRNLENKGLGESTLERPMRYVATPFEQVLDSLIEEKRTVILSQWKTMNAREELQTGSERFMILSGRENIYSKILQMISQVRKEMLVITTDVGVLLADRSNFFPRAITRAAEKTRISEADVNARVLTQVTRENLLEVESLIKGIQQRHLSVQIRHSDICTNSSQRGVIVDEEEAIIFLTTRIPSSLNAQSALEETALWTNSKAVARGGRAFFEELWRGSMDISKRSDELNATTV